MPLKDHRSISYASKPLPSMHMPQNDISKRTKYTSEHLEAAHFSPYNESMISHSEA